MVGQLGCASRNNRKLGEARIDKRIRRGYGAAQERLKNGSKGKVFPAQKPLLCVQAANGKRMTWSMRKAIVLYKRRWRIEETFRALKTCLPLNGCQHHTMQAQVLYLFMALLLFANLQIVSGISVYNTTQTAISGEIQLEYILDKRIFRPC